MTRDTKESGRAPRRLRAVINGLVMVGPVSLPTVAARLGTSPRTLQRRLRARGTTFWAVVAQCRFEISSALLCDTDLPVQTIARQVGYSTPGAFARAFTGWAGQSPRAFRTMAEVSRLASEDWRELGGTVPGNPIPSRHEPDPSEQT